MGKSRHRRDLCIGGYVSAAAASWDSASQAMSQVAASLSTAASAFSMHASIELRLMQWELQKAIADLNSYDHRSRVIQELDDKVSADRGFSFRHQFGDQWFDLRNQEQTAAPMVVRFRTRRADFPPNLEDLKIQHVVLYFARAGGTALEVPVTYLRFAGEGEAAPVGGGATSIDGIISTRKGNAASWTATLGKAPCGDWDLALLSPLLDGRKPSELFATEPLEDILLVITYSAKLPKRPE
ncbi:MAG: hypothetical protein R6X05_08895 [Desulfobacterales bacterium]